LSPAAYLGTDISPLAIAQAETRFAQEVNAGLARFAVADGLSAADAEGPFDAVVIADCLEYLGSVPEVLQRCAERLAPDGVVGVTQWLAQHPLGLWRELKLHAEVLDEAVVMAPWGGAWQVWTCRPKPSSGGAAGG